MATAPALVLPHLWQQIPSCAAAPLRAAILFHIYDASLCSRGHQCFYRVSSLRPPHYPLSHPKTLCFVPCICPENHLRLRQLHHRSCSRGRSYGGEIINNPTCNYMCLKPRAACTDIFSRGGRRGFRETPCCLINKRRDS